MKSTLCALVMIFISGLSFSQQASLTIKNKSERHLTIKVMQGSERKAIQYKTDSIQPKGSKIIYFSEPGMYFTKTQAVMIDKKDAEMNDTLYSKDRPFNVISDKRRGYSNITMEYKIKESKKNDGNTISITRKEYNN